MPTIFNMKKKYIIFSIFLLFRDPSEKIQRKTAVKENSLNPIFQEIVVFPLKEKLVAETKIRVSLWDKDAIGWDDFLGESVIELCKLDLITGDIFPYNLHPRVKLTWVFSFVNCNFPKLSRSYVTAFQSWTYLLFCWYYQNYSYHNILLRNVSPPIALIFVYSSRQEKRQCFLSICSNKGFTFKLPLCLLRSDCYEIFSFNNVKIS